MVYPYSLIAMHIYPYMPWCRVCGEGLPAVHGGGRGLPLGLPPRPSLSLSRGGGGARLGPPHPAPPRPKASGGRNRRRTALRRPAVNHREAGFSMDARATKDAKC